jgi:hypothetical protein
MAAQNASNARWGAKPGTEIVERAMSLRELTTLMESVLAGKPALLRGGARDTPHFVSPAVNSTAVRALRRLALPKIPEVRVTMRVPAGVFSPATRVDPNFGQPGGGLERIAPGNLQISVEVLRIWYYR